MNVTVTPLAGYRNATPYPFCPGCGHTTLLDALDRALVEVGVPPERVVLVSDIGCSGLSDQYFDTNAFHGLHGRSLTYATGIKLARPELEVIVLMGDGSAGIGGAHLLNAARRNVGITLVVFNNLNFGMTGGQHSVTTPLGAFTSTTPGGNFEQPLDLCATAAVNGAAWVWRGTSFDGDLAERIADAVRSPGFALLDVWEPCTAHFVPRNKLGKRRLVELIEKLGFQKGLVAARQVDEYSTAYRAAQAAVHGQPTGRGPAVAPQPLATRREATLDRRFTLVVAGSAGGRVRSALRLLAETAVRSGLWAAQRDDYPITVRSGHSVSELVLSPEEIHFAGVERPDALLLLSEDGRKQSARYLARMTPDDRVFVLPSIAGVETAARVTVLDLVGRTGRIFKPSALLAAVATIEELGLFPIDGLRAAGASGISHREV